MHPARSLSLKDIIPIMIKPTIRRLILKYRQLSRQKRAFPSFIIIGAQKSGTSSLYAYLSQHPQLIPSYIKEVHYFDGGLNPNQDTYQKGPAWYRAHFPRQEIISSQQQTFEASPLYLFNPLTPERIREVIPRAKMIALLRHPTERAISHYFHERQRGWETLSMEEAFAREEERLATSIQDREYKNNAFIHYSYKSRGLYHRLELTRLGGQW